jgi:hypothetical protein
LTKNLASSSSLLKLEKVIETKKKYYLIYEHARNLNKRDLKYGSINKKIGISVLTGLGEINSFQLSICGFEWKNVLITDEGRVKIGLFTAVTKHGKSYDFKNFGKILKNSSLLKC